MKPGEIHALLGENGAGKSTLVKMIYGIMQPDAGEIRWNGEPCCVANPKAARKLGIGMVFQHFSLFEAMTVLENIALGMDAKVPQRELEAKIRAVMEQYGLRLDPHRIVADLSVGERQRIEIVRALLLNPTLLIMDEPTSVLTPQEVEQLFVVLRQLAKEGCSILYISHKLHEIKALCDTATILRGGKLVDTCDPKVETSRSMAEKMIGGSLKTINKPAGRASARERLVVNRLSWPASGHFGISLKRHQLHRAGRRDLRHRRGRRQRPERAAAGAERARSRRRCRMRSPSMARRSARSTPSSGASRGWPACPRSATGMRRCRISRSRTTPSSRRATGWAWRWAG